MKKSPRSLLVDDGKASPTSGNLRGLGNCHDNDSDDDDDDFLLRCPLLSIMMMIMIRKRIIMKQHDAAEERFSYR